MHHLDDELVDLEIMLAIITDDLEVEAEVTEGLYGYLLILGTLLELVQLHDEQDEIEVMLM